MKRFLKWVMAFCVVGALANPLDAFAEGDYSEDSEVSVVSVAVDVSGSMRKTDADRDATELLKMFIDICDSNDYFSVTAYNDDIVYCSGPVLVGNKPAVEALKADLDALQYSGDTDNGLGMLKATKAITDSGIKYDRAMVLLISDGDTDLANSRLNRTLEESNADIELSGQLAVENNIAINVVEYTDSLTNDTGLFSVTTAATGGRVNVVNESVQFAQVMLTNFFTCYDGGLTSFKKESKEELLNKAELVPETEKYEREYFLIYSKENIQEFQILNSDVAARVVKEDRYAIVDTTEANMDRIEMNYILGAPTEVLIGVAKVEKKPEQEVVVEQIEVEVERPSLIPVGKELTVEEYSSQSKYEVNVDQLFEDDDIVKYSLENTADERFELKGSLLLVDISKEADYSVKVIATDAVGNTAEAKVDVKITAAWKQYYVQIVIAVIIVIFCIAIVICAIIIKNILFRNQKKKLAINGRLVAKFIDLKTKNDIKDAEWNLSKYPPEGVSLEELFKSIGIKEELKDLDKLCFYPSEYQNEVVLLHCIEGGVFVGDHHVKANTPVYLKNGDKIYVSVAENASEIELTYIGM